MTPTGLGLGLGFRLPPVVRGYGPVAEAEEEGVRARGVE